MARKRYKPEEIVAKLRQVDVLVSQGQNMVDATAKLTASPDPSSQRRDLGRVGYLPEASLIPLLLSFTLQ
jgi:hypothetical protein